MLTKTYVGEVGEFAADQLAHAQLLRTEVVGDCRGAADEIVAAVANDMIIEDFQPFY